MEEAKEIGSEWFLYVPADEVFATEDLTKHHRLARFFAPANWVDREFFGGPQPVRGGILRLEE